MGSHSVTCHPAEVTFPPLPQPIKAGTRFSDPRGDVTSEARRLSLLVWVAKHGSGTDVCEITVSKQLKRWIFPTFNY